MSREKVKIQKIKPEDNQVIFVLIQEILESYDLDQPGTAYTDPYLNHLYEYYQKESRGEYWVLKKKEQVIGGIGIAPFGHYEEVAELQKYYIKEQYQGFGYGPLLFETAFSFASEMGYEKIYIETSDRLDQANRIYKHFGFKTLAEPLPGSEHGKMNRWLLLELI